MASTKPRWAARQDPAHEQLPPTRPAPAGHRRDAGQPGRPPADTEPVPGAGPAAIRTVTASAVGSLLDLLNDPGRNEPVLVVSVASDTGRPRVDPDRLAAAASGAQIAVLTDMVAAKAFSAIAEEWATYGGAVRLIPPESAHDIGGLFLTFPDTAPELTISRITRRLAAPRATRAVPAGLARVPARPAPFVPTPAQLPRPRQPDQAKPLPAQPDPDTSPVQFDNDRRPHPRAAAALAEPGFETAKPIAPAGLGEEADNTTHPSATAAQLAATTTTIHAQQLTDDLTGERAAHARTQRERDELYDELQRRDDTADDREDDFYLHPVFADPTAQFRHELDLRLLHKVDEATRTAHRPAEYTLGPMWLDDLEDRARTSKVRRTKVLDVAIHVLLGRAHTVPGLDVHQVRESAAGGASFIRRADGSVGWRASLQSSAPAARRLMWWSRPDGSIELARVAKHDDLRMP